MSLLLRVPAVSFFAVVSCSSWHVASLVLLASMLCYCPSYGFRDVAGTHAVDDLSAFVDAGVVDGVLADAGIPSISFPRYS